MIHLYRRHLGCHMRAWVYGHLAELILTGANCALGSALVGNLINSTRFLVWCLVRPLRTDAYQLEIISAVVQVLVARVTCTQLSLDYQSI